MPVGLLGEPALRVLEWRYRATHVAPRADRTARGCERAHRPRLRPGQGGARTPHVPGALRHAVRTRPKERPAGTGRGCRAVVAARLLAPGSEWRVLRALQLANFTTHSSSTTTRGFAPRCATFRASIPMRSSRGWTTRVTDAYERDKAEARSASGTPPRRSARPRRPMAPSASPRRRSSSSGMVRGSSPAAGSRSSRTTCSSRTSSRARAASRTRRSATSAEHFPDGLTTAEVAGLLAAAGPHPGLGGNRAGASRSRRARRARRVPLGQDALWLGA